MPTSPPRDTENARLIVDNNDADKKKQKRYWKTVARQRATTQQNALIEEGAKEEALKRETERQSATTQKSMTKEEAQDEAHKRAVQLHSELERDS